MDAIIFHTSRFRHLSKYIIFIALLILGLLSTLVSFRTFVAELMKRLGIDLSGYGFLYAMPLLTAAILLIALEVLIRKNRIIVGARTIRIEIGLLSRKTSTIHYYDVSDVHVKQSVLQRLLRHGDLEIGVKGGTLHQNITPQFAGRGDVKFEVPRKQLTGVQVEGVQNIRQLEKLIMKHMEEHHM